MFSFVMLAQQPVVVSPWWIVATLLLIAAVIHDWRGGTWKSWHRNLVIGVVLAVVFSAGLHAAEVPVIDWCTIWGWPWWMCW